MLDAKHILSNKLIYLKAILFLIIGITGFLYCWSITFDIPLFLTLLVTIWAWCRLYYFIFYVIEKYVDSGYKFSGIINFFCYVFKKIKSKRES